MFFNYSLQPFQIMHSELIMEVQCIEHDLKVIFAFMRKGNPDKNFRIVEDMSLGEIINELRMLDNSDHNPDLSRSDYKLLHEIRELRNYWCHQCYIDFVYIANSSERNIAFNEVYSGLKKDKERIHDLYRKLENFRIKEVERYRR